MICYICINASAGGAGSPRRSAPGKSLKVQRATKFTSLIWDQLEYFYYAVILYCVYYVKLKIFPYSINYLYPSI